ncbi:MAG TPA: ATP-binding protein [Isosphaeraceae bacterium]
MGSLSIRLRLTAFNGAVLGAILVGLGLAVYLLMGRALLERIDAALAFEYQEAVERLRKDGAGEDLGAVPEAFLETYLLLVTDRDGRVRLRSPALEGAVLPPPTHSGSADPEFRTAAIGRLGPQRVLTGEVAGPDGVRVVQIATSLESYGRELAELRAALLVLLPAGLVAAVAGGYGLAGRALAPVDRITEAARRISAQNLRERIEVANPRDELGRLAATLNAMVARLAEALDALRRFTADASHELMTPLTAIRTEAEVALQSARSPEQHAEVLASIVEEVDRLTRLANRLLLLAREDAGASPPGGPPIQLDRVVRDAADRVRAPAARAGLVLRVEDLPAATVAADPDRLRQVFDNLLDNAVAYNRPGGSVVVRGRCSDGRAIVEVADTGIGIPPEAQGRVFDRFYRVDPARGRRRGGSGLGLSIVRALVEGLRGRVELESQPGQGSTFRVILPLGPDPVRQSP